MALTTTSGLTAFCQVFEHGGKWYAYDVHTNNLLHVDPVLAQVLRFWQPYADDEIVLRFADRFSPASVRKAIREIKNSRKEEGLFLPDRPTAMAPCLTCHDRDGYATRLSHLTLTLTEQCNLRCRYCLHSSSEKWHRPYSDRAMPLSTALAAVDYFAQRCSESQFPTVSFYGGEPLLQFDLIRQVVKQARASRSWPELRFIIDTNGTLMSEQVVEFIAREGIHLQISLDGPDRLHDRYRLSGSGHGSHREVLDGVRRLLSRDPSIADRLTFSVTLAPPYDLLAVADFFGDFPPYREAGLDKKPQLQVNLADLTGIDLGASEQEEDRSRDFQRNLDRARHLYVEACSDGGRGKLSPALTAFFDRGLISFYHRSLSPLPAEVGFQGCCLPGQRRLHVRADGALQTCERVGMSLVIGHVDTGIDMRLIDRLYSGMEKALGRRCLDCWAVRLCDMCFTAMAPTWGELGSDRVCIPEEICERIRKGKMSVFRLYLTLLERGPESLAFLKNTSVM